ncbi:manganese catalase family protein [Muricoccus nepalensis]|uniref:manganese catalase family protein n=1 Tax=Muricoccus nepalensis TaxID=1854500 RepID=UPI0013875751|nr:manganese catalase family protein [Roseomonas nepalensis]
MGATPEIRDGVPVNANHVDARGTSRPKRVLATRLCTLTDDRGMRDMLSLLIARGTTRPQPWLTAVEEPGGLEKRLPVPDSFPQAPEKHEFAKAFFLHGVDGAVPERR